MIQEADVISLFDGMACGMLAMQEAGIKVKRYVAFEIDKYAVKTSSHNFPMIEHRGDVFQADFTEFSGFDFLVGGSPCTYWSIAQKNNRETEASGMGWELFSQYVRAVKEAQPKYFIYENNKSMSKAIRESISKTFGFEPICINSALVSAQNRQRLYWVGRRNEDGTYSKVHVEQPEDRGILLKDVLDSGVHLSDKDKSFALTTRCCGAIPEDTLTKNRHSMVAEELKPLTERELDYMVRQTSGDRNHFDFGYIQDATKDKGACLTANISKGVPYNVCCVPVRVGSLPSEDGTLTNSQGVRIYSIDGKGVTLCGNGGGQGAKTGLYAEPIEESATLLKAIPEIAEKFGYLPEMFNAYNRAEITDKAPTLSTGSMVTSSCAVNKLEPVAEPLRVQEATTKGYVDIDVGDCVDLTMPNSKTRRGRSMKDKSNCLMTGCQYYQYIGTTKHPIYEVKDGFITIKGKQYPIKLVDGYYIIRKLTVSECKRLQTVPEWYEFPVSDTQAYKMLGNGWTVEVIAHLIRATQSDALAEEQINLFEMVGA